jgi:hypothetical protein
VGVKSPTAGEGPCRATPKAPPPCSGTKVRMTGSELQGLFALFTAEDFESWQSGLQETYLRYSSVGGPGGFDRFWADVEKLVRDLASTRLERCGAELIAALT